MPATLASLAPMLRHPASGGLVITNQGALSHPPATMTPCGSEPAKATGNSTPSTRQSYPPPN